MSKLGPMANRQAESGKGLFTLFFQPNSKDGEAEKRKKKKKKKKKIKLYMKIIPTKRIN